MFLKRAGWSLWRHKFRNILILLVFSAILAVTLTCFMIYAGTSYQVEVTQKAVANAVTLMGDEASGHSIDTVWGLPYDVASRFVKGPHVERYNLVTNYLEMEALNLVPAHLTEHQAELYREYCERARAATQEYLSEMNNWWFGALDKRHLKDTDKEYRWDSIFDEVNGFYLYDIYNGDYTPEENAQLIEDYNLFHHGYLRGEVVPQAFTITAVSDSEYYDSFASEGYALVEGRHFKSEEEDQPYILLSRAVAQENGLQVGDTVELSFDMGTREMATFYKDDPWELTIVGLFDPPDRDDLGAIGYQSMAENYIFVPYQAMINYLHYLYNNDTLLWAPFTNRATVYVDTPENVQEFVDYAYDTFALLELDSKTGRPSGTSIEALKEDQVFTATDQDDIDRGLVMLSDAMVKYGTFYTLTIDRDWYQMIAMPLESMNDLSLFMGIGLLTGAFAALLLVCILNVRRRKREVGVLLSMGESRLKIFLQMFIEQAVPLVLAAAIGFGAGVPLASQIGNGMLESRSEKVNAAYEQDKLDYLAAQLGTESLDTAVTMNIRSAAATAAPVKMQFALDTNLAWGYFALAFGMLFLTVLIQMVFLLRLSPAKIMTRRN